MIKSYQKKKKKNHPKKCCNEKYLQK